MPDRLQCVAAEQFDHPAGSGTDVDEASERLIDRCAGDGLLDFALGDVERADLVPDLRVRREIARCRFGAFDTDPVELGGVRFEQRLLASSAQASISSNIGAGAVAARR